MVTTLPEKVSWLFSYGTADLKLMVLYHSMCHSSPTAALGYLWDNSDAHGCVDPQKSCCVTFSLLFLFSILHLRLGGLLPLPIQFLPPLSCQSPQLSNYISSKECVLCFHIRDFYKKRLSF